MIITQTKIVDNIIEKIEIEFEEFNDDIFQFLNDSGICRYSSIIVNKDLGHSDFSELYPKTEEDK